MARITQDILSTIFGLTEDPLGRPLTRAGRTAVRDGIPPWHPRNDGEGGEGGEGAGEGEGAGAGGEGEGEGEGAGEGGGGGEKSADHYRKQLRDFERSAKRGSEKSQKRIAELEAKLKEREQADQSEQEKALAKAREDGKAEALTEAQKERRADRLEVAVTRAAATGVKVKVTENGEEKTQTVKFADPDDALLWIKKAIADDDLSEDDIFDENGKVKADGLTEALTDLAERKPHYLAREQGSSRLEGDGDGRKGRGSRTDDEMTIDEHLAATRRHKPSS